MSLVYNKGKFELGTGATVWTSSTIKMLLVKSGYTANADHNFVSDITNELTNITGTGYERKTLASKTATEDDTNDRVAFDAADVLYTSIDAGTAIGLVIYRDSGADATSPLICYIDGGFPVITNGGDVTLQFNAAGILLLT